MLFLGKIFNPEDERKILKTSRCGLQTASNKFQLNLLRGLVENYAGTIKVISVLPIGVWPHQYKKLVLEDKKSKLYEKEVTEIGSINLPFLKQWIRTIKIRKKLREECKTHKKIIVYTAYTPFLAALRDLDSSVQVTLVVTDLPEYADLGSVGIIRRLMRKWDNKKIYEYMQRIDNFVILTEDMKYPLGIKQRPYVVVEGLADRNEITTAVNNTVENDNTKIIFYSGTLHYRYGIKNLLDAFSQMNNDNVQLWICGDGEAKDEIKERAEQDKRIKFWGFVPNQECLRMQQQASILVNPRPNIGEYVKYSFPSKTMEYLMSGKVTVMYKLAGVPDEYDPYLYYPQDDTVDALKNLLTELCAQSAGYLNEMGAKGRLFVMEQKNCSVQTRKITNMIEEYNAIN